MDSVQALQTALRYHGSGRLDEAAALYEDILQADGNHLQGLFGRGMVALQRHDFPDAARFFARAAEIEPGNAEIHNNLGAAFQGMGRHDEAIACYREAIRTDPRDAGAYINLGTVFQRLERQVEAIECYRQALELEQDNAALHNNLGAALQDIGRLDDAVECFQTALALAPDYAGAYVNLGTAQRDRGELEDALGSFRRALDIRPGVAKTYFDIAVTLQAQDRLAEAIEHYERAVERDPEFVDAYHNLGNALFAAGRTEEALAIYESLDMPICRAKVLECHFALKSYDRLYAELEARLGDYATNIRAAAISAFASHQLKRADPHPFCRTPLDFLRVTKIGHGAEGMIDGLIEELEGSAAVWEPFRKTTKGGYQTPSVLFDNPAPRIAELEAEIRSHVQAYRAEFAHSDCGFIRSFPEDFSLVGWYVRLLRGGHQDLHIHPSGWLSGVLYLQMPEVRERREGAIEFSLWGYKYPVLDDSYPRMLHEPEPGDLVLFPSSLFHRTIPFDTEGERRIIAFDLVPGRSGTG